VLKSFNIDAVFFSDSDAPGFGVFYFPVQKLFAYFRNSRNSDR
jgi:hypothetical protein